MLGNSEKAIHGLAWVYLVCVSVLGVFSFFTLTYGHWLYDELCLSREEWEQRKRLGEKKKFRKTQELLSFLQEKNTQGLVLTDYENGKYLYEESESSYQYEIDTKQALKKRLKAQGKKYSWERKDWNLQSFQWYEMSIAEAQSKGLEMVCIIDGETLVYKRVYEVDEQEAVLNPDYNEAMGWIQKFLDKGCIWAVLFGGGFVLGLISGMLS